MFIGKYNKSLIVTYIGVVFAILGMNFALLGNLKYTMICMVVSGVCDLFDGKIARMCKRTEEEKKFGVEIDSLADTVAFVIFPVVIGYSLGLNEWHNILGYVLLVLAGITRLGYFNICVIDKNKDEPVKTYSGLPVTSTSIIIPVLWFITSMTNGVSFENVFTYVIYLIAFLFVFNMKIPKIKGKAYWVVGIIAVIGIALLLFLV
ncbi:MAG: CDP-alcohol phosphatidyltransferase family protein [Bacilli bacterium]